ncbi:E3 ubiquitin-protein ligase Praja-2 [Dimargaris verticillata]|uniref:E3 ubiquitin-protein ligase Praja-2 n=1 Tax=Dimargaris verticillata TaxID=2761393 RepID=A0A9W8EEH5_9FUNG|nr:E3 ubiquitin-protein ligase Praja-2 [Dimargaris verticillata]
MPLWPLWGQPNDSEGTSPPPPPPPSPQGQDSSQPLPAESQGQTDGTQDHAPQQASPPLDTANHRGDTSPAAIGPQSFPHVVFYFHAAPSRPPMSPLAHSGNGSDEDRTNDSTSPAHATELNDGSESTHGEHNPAVHSVTFVVDRPELLSLLPMMLGLPPHAFFPHAFGPTGPLGLQGQPPASKHAMHDLPLISRNQLQWLAQQYRLAASAEQQDEPAALICLICQDDLQEEVAGAGQGADGAPQSHQDHDEQYQRPTENAVVHHTGTESRGTNNDQAKPTIPPSKTSEAASPPPCFVRQMPCGHMFHEDCLFSWLKVSNTCPTCRFEVMTDNADYNQVVERRMEERRKSQSSPIINNPFHWGCALAPLESCDATLALAGDNDDIWDEHYTFPQCHHDFHLPCLRTTLITQGLEPKTFERLAAERHRQAHGTSEPYTLSPANTTTMVRCPACNQYNAVPDKDLETVLLCSRAPASSDSLVDQGQMSPLTLHATEPPADSMGAMDLD